MRKTLLFTLAALCALAFLSSCSNEILDNTADEMVGTITLFSDHGEIIDVFSSVCVTWRGDYIRWEDCLTGDETTWNGNYLYEVRKVDK